MNVPTNALGCGTSGDGDGCYLGQTVYSDAICDETIGKIHMTSQKNEITGKHYGLAYGTENYMNEHGKWTTEGETCPFFNFIVL